MIEYEMAPITEETLKRVLAHLKSGDVQAGIDLLEQVLDNTYTHWCE